MKLIFLMAATGKYHFLIYHSALPLELVPEKLHTHTHTQHKNYFWFLTSSLPDKSTEIKNFIILKSHDLYHL